MRYSKLGTTGLEVSAIALGCMSFGEPDRGGEPWSLGADASRDIIRQALESGVTFFDTANGYSAGSSEEIVGQAVKDFTRREEVVLSTKVWMRMRPGPNGAGLSRKVIFAELDASLRRFRSLFHVRLAVRQDSVPGRPERLDPVRVDAGPLQPHPPGSRAGDASALRRPGHRRDPLEPAGAGRLTRVRNAATARAETDEGRRILYRDEDQAVAERVHEIAGKRGLSPAQVALAWVMRNPAVTAPIVGVTKPAQLADAVAAVDVELDEDEAAYLEEPYQPHQTAYLEESFYTSRPRAGSR